MVPLEVVIFRMALALVYSSLIGLEREWRHKAAGIKTNVLVAVGSATFAMMTVIATPRGDPTRIAAAIVGGIGFIGAGVMIYRGATVQGVTTAATLWADAAVGTAIGIGQYPLATVSTVAILITQFAMRRVGRQVKRMSSQGRASRFELRVAGSRDAVDAASAVAARFARELALVLSRRSMTHRDRDDVVIVRAVYRVPEDVQLDLTTIEREIISLHGVREIEVRYLGAVDEEA